MINKFLELEKVQNALKSRREYILKNFEQYIEAFDNDISNYIELKKKQQGIWISMVGINTSFRYCIEALETLNEIQFEIALAAIIEDFESYPHPHANFERTFSVICRQLEAFKIEIKRTQEVEELFKE